MLRQAEYHPEAKLEMREAASWYDDKVDGLGLDFLFEVKNAESYIVQNPELWPNYEAGTKRYMTLLIYSDFKNQDTIHCG